jgi:NAD(P)-dependent dehydrogenase (short-subunit alcohol dehydrogenase family)
MAGPFSLDGQVAFVTGAARGIGRATAVELARHGADVALLDIAAPDAIPELPYPLASADELGAAVDFVRQQGARAITIVADVRDLAAMQAAAERTVAELGGLNVAVANAGVWVETSPGQARHAPWQVVLDVNLLGVNHTVDAALPFIRRGQGGRIVIVSSQNARGGSAQTPAYAASKWAVTGLMKSLALALGPDGIAVNAVAPTAVDTVLLRQGPFAGMDEAAMNEVMRQENPLPVGVLQPEEIASAIAFLAGPEARFVSGVMLDVNAGRSGRLTA